MRTDNGPNPRAPTRIVLATSNPGKLHEYKELGGSGVEIKLLENFRDLPQFDESASTFAENAAGKALHYSRYSSALVLADDSGLVVPALGGAPGVHSARYAGPSATDADRCAKLLRAMNGMTGESRCAHFVCIIALSKQGRVAVVASDRADGLITNEPCGQNGFGYDPVFYFSELGRTYAELSARDKNQYSHRGKAFRKALNLLSTSPI